jgi:hypothetical protein
VRIEYGHSIRSAITVDGIVGNTLNNSQIRGSYPSTSEPVGSRRYFGGPSLANAAFTVFLEIPITRAISAIGICSARRSRRISAQSSTLSTRFLPGSAKSQGLGGSWSNLGCRAVVSFQLPSTDNRGVGPPTDPSDPTASP